MGRVWLDRKILEWEWWDDINTYRLFTYCLLRANWKDTKFQGVEIPRGAFVTSLASLAKSTGLSIQSVRTAISHLKSTGELTVNQHAKFSVVIVNNYNRYQDINTVDNSQLTSNQQGTNRLPTTEEEYKKDKKNKKNTLSGGESKKFIPPTVEEVDAYCQERQNGITGFEFCSFYESKGWMVGKNKMKSWKGAVRTWEAKRGFSYQPKKETPKNEGYEEVTLDDM